KDSREEAEAFFFTRGPWFVEREEGCRGAHGAPERIVESQDDFSCVLENEDMSNAFGSTEWASLRACLPKMVLREDEGFARQRFEEAVVCMPAKGGHVDMSIGSGALMGDPFALEGHSHRRSGSMRRRSAMNTTTQWCVC
ncbi:MAG: hypothetical protein ACKPKO_25725, partial [Candidatus Fonsibacter sp.]